MKRFVIIRDDDTNVFTPIEYLEKLYHPFLSRGLPVNLAVIPAVNTKITLPDGTKEKFLLGQGMRIARDVPITDNPSLIHYLLNNPLFSIVQHGYSHDFYEFASDDRKKIIAKMDEGRKIITEAGFPYPETFVAPYDQLSKISLYEAAHRYRVISTGWFEWKKIPLSWWGKYVWKKIQKKKHWRVGNTLLLSHPGCLLSYQRDYKTMFETVRKQIESTQLTVLVTHWWEYFRDGRPDFEFIGILHQVADYLSKQREIEVISFRSLLTIKNISF